LKVRRKKREDEDTEGNLSFPAHLLTCSPSHLLTLSSSHLLTFSTFLPSHLLTFSPSHLLTSGSLFVLSPFQQLTLPDIVFAGSSVIAPPLDKGMKQLYLVLKELKALQFIEVGWRPGWRDGGMGWRDGGMEGWRDGDGGMGMEGWRDGGMEGWRDGGWRWRDEGI
jgi:hypothetical protein